MKIPASELNAPGVLCRTERKEEYQITYNHTKDKFTLWKLTENNAEKLSCVSDIEKLYRQIPWRK